MTDRVQTACQFVVALSAHGWTVHSIGDDRVRGGFIAETPHGRRLYKPAVRDDGSAAGGLAFTLHTKRHVGAAAAPIDRNAGYWLPFPWSQRRALTQRLFLCVRRMRAAGSRSRWTAHTGLLASRDNALRAPRSFPVGARGGGMVWGFRVVRVARWEGG